MQIRSATGDDVEACARVLARAFHDDPGTMLIEPDAERRRAIFPAFFRTFVVASLASGGDLVVPEGEVLGLASWFGPDSHAPADAAMGEAGMAEVVDAFGPAATQRMVEMTGELERQHKARMTGPHLRLEFFGVDPEVQGRGIGGALMQHGHRRADALGLPCYLETFTEENVRYYEHRGYGVMGTYHVGEGVPVYAMRREPA
jgi:GNAT superfamily N-acetyltransferase